MVSLLREAQKRDGRKKVLFCNSRCWDAKRPLCDCPCGGINHGVGLQAAIENTHKMQVEGRPGVIFNEEALKPVGRPRDARGHFIKVETNKEFVNQTIYDVV